jgi:hypothetical protein
MTIEAQVCPQCGSAIHFKRGQPEVVCDSCGTTVVKSSTPRGTSLAKEMAEEKLIQEIAARETRLYRDGRQATAKILTAQTTNIIRNNLNGKGVLMSFTVEVLPKDESPYNAETKAMIGLVAIEKYQPGTVLDVCYDPQDHTQVSVEGRHGVPSSNPLAEIQKADEQIREADEMLHQADEEYRQAEEKYKNLHATGRNDPSDVG